MKVQKRFFTATLYTHSCMHNIEISAFKGDLTHTVSPNLMLILSTYRVVLHPSYLQKVFSFIIFVKEIYSFTILSEKSQAPGGALWAELKSDEHLSADRQQNRDI